RTGSGSGISFKLKSPPAWYFKYCEKRLSCVKDPTIDCAYWPLVEPAPSANTGWSVDTDPPPPDIAAARIIIGASTVSVRIIIGISTASAILMMAPRNFRPLSTKTGKNDYVVGCLI